MVLQHLHHSLLYADGAVELRYSKNRGNPRYHEDLSSLYQDGHQFVIAIDSLFVWVLHIPLSHVILTLSQQILALSY